MAQGRLETRLARLEAARKDKVNPIHLTPPVRAKTMEEWERHIEGKPPEEVTLAPPRAETMEELLEMLAAEEEKEIARQMAAQY